MTHSVTLQVQLDSEGLFSLRSPTQSLSPETQCESRVTVLTWRADSGVQRRRHNRCFTQRDGLQTPEVTSPAVMRRVFMVAESILRPSQAASRTLRSHRRVE